MILPSASRAVQRLAVPCLALSIAAHAALAAQAALAGCGAAPPAPLANQAARGGGPSGEVRAIDWLNRTYVLDELGPVAVRGGEAEFVITDDNKAAASGTAEGARGTYSVARPLFADIDGDGVEDAIISSVLSTGGTGRFSEVRVYTMRGGKVVTLATIPGGDRGDGGLRRVSLEGPTVIVERNVLAEGDGACCASAAQRERWVWRTGELTEDEAARRPMK